MLAGTHQERLPPSDQEVGEVDGSLDPLQRSKRPPYWLSRRNQAVPHLLQQSLPFRAVLILLQLRYHELLSRGAEYIVQVAVPLEDIIACDPDLSPLDHRPRSLLSEHAEHQVIDGGRKVEVLIGPLWEGVGGDAQAFVSIKTHLQRRFPRCYLRPLSRHTRYDFGQYGGPERPLNAYSPLYTHGRLCDYLGPVDDLIVIRREGAKFEIDHFDCRCRCVEFV